MRELVFLAKSLGGDFSFNMDGGSCTVGYRFDCPNRGKITIEVTRPTYEEAITALREEIAKHRGIR